MSRFEESTNMMMTATNILTGEGWSSCGAVLFILGGLVFCFRFLPKYYRFRTNPLRKAPGPTLRRFWTGETITIVKEPYFTPHSRWLKEAKEEAQKNASEEKGTKGGDVDIPLIAYSTLFGNWSVLLLDADLVQLVLTDSPTPKPGKELRFPKKFRVFVDLIGNGLITLEGDQWSRHRRIIQPSFQTSFVQQAVTASVQKRVTQLIDIWKTISSDRVIDVQSQLSAITLDVIGDVAFSHDFHGLDVIQDWADHNPSKDKNSGEDDAKDGSGVGEIQDPLIQALGRVFKIRVISIVFAVLQIEWVDKYINPEARRTRRLLNESADAIIANARRKNRQEQEATSSSTSMKAAPKSLIQRLIEATDQAKASGASRNELSDQELRDEAKVFIVAGHETTSTWCYWALYALGKHKDIQAKVFANIDKHAPGQKEITLENVQNMDYFLAFLQECLRLYSPAGMFFRYTGREEHWHGYTIPKGTRIVIPNFLLHRSPKYWKQPEEFSPERWLDQEQVKSRHPFCFLPFSAGGRNCIGQRFAEYEAQLILANIIRTFDIRLAPSIQDVKLQFTSNITMKAKPGVKICVKPRR